MKKVVSIIVFVLSAVVFASAQSDNCASATVITPNEAVCSYQNGSSANASQSLAGCSGNADDDVWYQFVANSTEIHVKVNPSDGYDAVIQLFSGTCGALVSEACEDTRIMGATEELVATGLTVGNTYFIRAYDFNAGSGSDDFSICVFGVPPPTNDVPCAAIALPTVTQNCTMGTYTNVGATDSGEPTTNACGADPNLGYAGGDVWFSAVVPANGAVEVSTNPGEITDSGMELYTGACGSLTRVGCDDDAGPGFMSYIYQSGLTPGETVYIRFWDFNNTNPGTFSICVSSPINDDCAESALICDFNGYGGITSGAYGVDRPDNMHGNGETAGGAYLGNGNTTHSGGPFGPADGTSPVYNVSIDNNSWLSFVANGPTAILDVEVEYCQTGAGLQMQVFSGTNCTNFAQVSNFIETAASQTITATGLTVGETYYIMIDGFGGDICNYTITAQSGVQVVDITSLAGTVVCNGQTTTLTVEAEGATSYAWSASPGGNFGTGQQSEDVTVTVPAVYTVTVTGFCDAAETASITITPDKVVDADYSAEFVGSGANITFPANVNCNDTTILLQASDSSSQSGYITPALQFIFTSDNFAQIDATNVTIYEDGNVIYNANLNDNEILSVSGEYLSPTSNYTFDLCETFGDGGVDWEVIDLNTGQSLGTGSMASGNPCETFGAFSPAGVSSWSMSPVVAGALFTTDYGFAIFNPRLAGAGTYDITYCWDNTVGCSDCETKQITINNPHDASWNTTSICENGGTLALPTLIDASASSTTGTWSGTGVSGNFFDPSGLSGNVAVTYSVGSSSTCRDEVTQNIFVDDAPNANDDALEACDIGNGTAIFDLTSVENAITGGSGDNVTWYSNATATTIIATPGNYTSGATTVYAVVTGAISGCTDTAEVDLQLNPQPTANNSSITECDNGAGQGVFDLTAEENTVNGGNGNNIDWYSNAAATASIGAPNSYTSGTATVYAVVTDGVTGCTDTAEVNLQLNPQPTANNTSLTECDNGAGQGIFYLTAEEITITGGSGNNVDWYSNAAATSAIGTPGSYTSGTTTVYAVITDGVTGCTDTAEVDLQLNPQPTANNSSITECDNGTNQAIFDLTTEENTITGGSGNVVSWYGNAAVTNAIGTPGSYTSGAATVYAVVTDGVTGCTDTAEVDLQLNPQPTANNSSITECDNGTGQGTFDLTAEENAITGGSGDNVDWYSNAAVTTAIGTPGNYTSGAATVYAVVTDGVTGCTDTAEVDLQLNPQPITSDLTPTVCEDVLGSGQASGIDLTANESNINSDAGSSFVWYDDAALTSPSASPSNTTVNNGDDFFVSVTDVNGCVNTASVTYNVTNTITLNDPNGAYCEDILGGNSVANVDLTQLENGIFVGSGAETFSWFEDAAMTSAVGDPTDVTLVDGTYDTFTVQVVDGSCSNTVTFTIDVNPLPNAQTATIEECGSGGTATFDLTSLNNTVNNGTADNVSWFSDAGLTTPIGTPNSFSSSSTTVFAEVTNSDNCSSSSSVTVTVNDTPVLTLTPTNSTCAGGDNGIVNSSIAGGNAPFTFIWGNGETTTGISGLGPNTYFATVTDVNSCTSSALASITEPPVMSVTGTTITEPTCSGFTNGGAEVSVTGGSGSYTFNWNNGATTNPVTGLTNGLVLVTITDASSANCSITESISVTTPNPIIVSSTLTHISCNGGSNGSISTSVSGGTPPYSYDWSTNATTTGISGLSAGNFQLTVTDDNSCLDIQTFNITGTSTSLSVSLTTNNVDCNGNDNGTASVVPQGGTSPYTFSWSTNESTQSISGLAPNTYGLTVTDANGCSTGGGVTTVSGCVKVKRILVDACSGGGSSEWDEEMLFMQIGNNPVDPTTLTISWPNPSNSWNGLCANPTWVSNTNLTIPAGDFLVEPTGNIPANSNVLLVSSDALTSSVMDFSQLTDTVYVLFQCAGNSQGHFTNYGTSGTTTRTLVVDFGGGCSETVSYEKDQLINQSGVPGSDDGAMVNYADDGSISYTNAGCVAPIDTVPAGTGVTFTITEPNVLAATASITNVSCFGQSDGAIDYTVTGGTTPYAYSWSIAGTANAQSGLSSGTYLTTITDANNCSVTESADVNQSGQLVISNEIITSVTCNGYSDGAVNITVSGGTTPYSYDWSTGSPLDNITSLVVGSYVVTVLDDNNCERIRTFDVLEPLPIIAEATVDHVTCFGYSDGSIDVEVSGGVSPYTFTWNTGSTDNPLTGLPQGNYTYTITDANNCDLVEGATVTEPPLLEASITSTEPLCFGNGSASATALPTGGTPGYTYLWSNNSTNQSVSGIPSGLYEVTVTDAASPFGCTVTESISITDPLPISITVVDGQTCDGTSDGTASVVVSGGTIPYSFAWENSNTTSLNTGLTSGVYPVTVTDNNNCIDSVLVTVSAIPLPIVNNITEEECEDFFGTGIGTVDLTSYNTAINNQGATFGWLEADGVTVVVNPTSTIINSSQTFVAEVYDGTCYNYATVDIGIVESIDISLSGGGKVCIGSDLTREVVFSFIGQPSYSFTYTNGADTFAVNNYGSSEYTINVGYEDEGNYYIVSGLSGNNCSYTEISDTVMVEASGPTADFSPSITEGDPPVDIEFTNLSSNTDFENYYWNFGDGQTSSEFEPIHTFESFGSYPVSLVVEDYLGCTDTAVYEFVEISNVSGIVIPIVFSPNGDGINDYFLIEGFNVSNTSGTVFNRWGEEMYNWSQIGQEWDGSTYAGSPAPGGTYFYLVKVEGMDGKIHEFNGGLTLIR